MGVNPGSPAFSIPDDESTQVRKLRDQERTTRENAAARSLEASQIGKGGLRVTDGGSIVVEAPGTIDLSSGTFSAATVNATTVTAAGNVVAGGTVQGAAVASTGGVSAGGNVTANGQVNAISSLRSVGAFNTDVSIYPGARQPMWQNNNGMIGYAPSTREKKTDVRPVPFTADNVRACIPRVFAYLTQIDIRDNPNNEFYDPTYVVPDEAGLFAEDLIKNGLETFVIYESDGVTPAGIDYAGFGAVANLVAVIDLDERLKALERRQP